MRCYVGEMIEEYKKNVFLNVPIYMWTRAAATWSLWKWVPLTLFVSTWRVTFQNENDPVSPQEIFFFRIKLMFCISIIIVVMTRQCSKQSQASNCINAGHKLKVRRNFLMGNFSELFWPLPFYGHIDHFISTTITLSTFFFNVPHCFSSFTLLKISFCCIHIKMDWFYWKSVATFKCCSDRPSLGQSQDASFTKILFIGFFF